MAKNLITYEYGKRRDSSLKLRMTDLLHEMRIAYINCGSGVAGDMLLGSLIDAGISPVKLERELKRTLNLNGWQLKTKKVTRCHLPGVQVEVAGGDKRVGSPATMMRILKSSKLSLEAKRKALEILSVLVKAEMEAHGLKEKEVHFHELDSIDTIVDIAGVCLGFHWLKIEYIVSSSLNIGQAGPAACAIIKNGRIPVYSDSDIREELTTPTGAAIISVLANKFGPIPPIYLDICGFGAGSRNLKGKANLLRLTVGRKLLI